MPIRQPAAFWTGFMRRKFNGPVGFEGPFSVQLSSPGRFAGSFAKMDLGGLIIKVGTFIDDVKLGKQECSVTPAIV
jgi:hypothetical protein